MGMTKPGEGAREVRRGGDGRYRSFFFNAPIGLYITTADGRIVDANPALVRMLDYPNKDSLLGMNALAFFVDPDDRLRLHTMLGDSPVVTNYDTQLRRRDGEIIWVRDTCYAVRDSDGEVILYEGSLQDITAERRTAEELEYMARHDPLTGLLNRHTLRTVLDCETCRARRYNHPIGVLMIDVNRFKEINDRFGHAAGDRVLCAAADLVRRCVRESDVVVRYGGDEFLVLLIETDGETGVVCDRIRAEAVALSNAAPSCDAPVTLAIGTAHWLPQSGVTIESVLSRADRAMYEEKARWAAGEGPTDP